MDPLLFIWFASFTFFFSFFFSYYLLGYFLASYLYSVKSSDSCGRKDKNGSISYSYIYITEISSRYLLNDNEVLSDENEKKDEEEEEKRSNK